MTDPFSLIAGPAPAPAAQPAAPPAVAPVVLQPVPAKPTTWPLWLGLVVLGGVVVHDRATPPAPPAPVPALVAEAVRHHDAEGAAFAAVGRKIKAREIKDKAALMKSLGSYGAALVAEVSKAADAATTKGELDPSLGDLFVHAGQALGAK